MILEGSDPDFNTYLRLPPIPPFPMSHPPSSSFSFHCTLSIFCYFFALVALSRASRSPFPSPLLLLFTLSVHLSESFFSFEYPPSGTRNKKTLGSARRSARVFLWLLTLWLLTFWLLTVPLRVFLTLLHGFVHC